MSDIKSWSETAANNNSASPDGFPENMAPSGVNNSAREVMGAVRRWVDDGGWHNWGHTYTYVSGTSFTIATDVSTIYHANRRIRAVGSATGTIYGTIVSGVYSAPNTTITVTWDSGSLSNETLAVSVGYLSFNNSAFAAVMQSGAQTVAGVKTFSSFPVTPSSAPTTDYQVANKKYVDDQAQAAAIATLQALAPKAWVVFTGATGAILASQGVSSVVHNATGQWTITWTTPFATVNYAVVVTISNATGLHSTLITVPTQTVNTTLVTMGGDIGGTVYAFDPIRVHVIAFGDQ